MDGRHWRAALVSSAACLILAGCSGDDGGGAPVATFESSPCEVDLPAGQSASDVECGYLTVPENRDSPGGRTIKLAVVVLHATGPDPAADPLVFLSGGPGGWAIDGYLPQYTAEFAAPIQSRRDVIFFDQRGTGRSLPALDCPEVIEQRDSFAELRTPDEVAEIEAAGLLECRDRLVREGNDLSAYSSAAIALDIADLMSALGYTRYNLYGLSYGTRVALTALRDQVGDRIRSVVLDSVVPLQGASIRPAPLERSLNLLFRDCAANAVCNSTYPDLEQKFFEVVDRLNANPATLMPRDSQGQPFTVVVSGESLLYLAYLAVQSRSLAEAVPFLTRSLFAGNNLLLAAALAPFGDPVPSSRGMGVSVLCNEETPFVTPELVDDANSGVNPKIVQAFPATDELMRVCPHWGVPAPDPKENEAVQSSAPALILAGEYDPNTPPTNGQWAAETLSHSYYFEFPGFGHVVLGQEPTAAGQISCAMQVIAQFLDDPTRAPDGSCVDAIGPPHFLGT